MDYKATIIMQEVGRDFGSHCVLEQISRMMNMAQMSVEPENLIVVGINMLIALLLFLIAYRHAAI